MKKKLLLLETEMRGPGGHYLDNLIESHFFQNDFETYALLNKAFDAEGTFIPNELNIYKIIKRNNIEKNNKLLHYFFEILIFLKQIFLHCS